MLDKPTFKKERKSLKAPLPQLRHCLIFFYFAFEQNFYKELLLSSKLKIPPKKEQKWLINMGKFVISVEIREL